MDDKEKCAQRRAEENKTLSMFHTSENPPNVEFNRQQMVGKTIHSIQPTYESDSVGMIIYFTDGTFVKIVTVDCQSKPAMFEHLGVVQYLTELTLPVVGDMVKVDFKTRDTIRKSNVNPLSCYKVVKVTEKGFDVEIEGDENEHIELDEIFQLEVIR